MLLAILSGGEGGEGGVGVGGSVGLVAEAGLAWSLLVVPRSAPLAVSLVVVLAAPLASPLAALVATTLNASLATPLAASSAATRERIRGGPRLSVWPAPGPSVRSGQRAAAPRLLAGRVIRPLGLGIRVGRGCGPPRACPLCWSRGGVRGSPRARVGVRGSEEEGKVSYHVITDLSSCCPRPSATPPSLLHCPYTQRLHRDRGEASSLTRARCTRLPWAPPPVAPAPAKPAIAPFRFPPRSCPLRRTSWPHRPW